MAKREKLTIEQVAYRYHMGQREFKGIDIIRSWPDRRRRIDLQLARFDDCTFDTDLSGVDLREASITNSVVEGHPDYIRNARHIENVRFPWLEREKRRSEQNFGLGLGLSLRLRQDFKQLEKPKKRRRPRKKPEEEMAEGVLPQQPTDSHAVFPGRRMTSKDLRWHYAKGRRNFSGLNLRTVDLSQEQLSGADFSGADLRCANLRRAVLQDANFEGADLRGAKLTKADLRGANLEAANLEETETTGTIFPDFGIPPSKN